jgi:PAS domain S-box-containing protein
MTTPVPDGARVTSNPSESVPAPCLRVSAGSVTVLVVLYFGAARLGLSFVVEPERIAVLWPGSGVLLGFLLVAGLESWWGFVAAAFSVVTLTNLSSGNPLGLSLGFAVANSLESVVSAFVVRRILRCPPDIDTVKHVVVLVGAAAVCTNAVTALIGAAVVRWGTGGDYWAVWRVWWIEDGVGMIVVAPAIIAASRLLSGGRLRWPGVSASGVLTSAALVAASIWVFLADPRSPFSFLASPYILLPIAYYGATRFGSGGAIASCLWICGAAMVGYSHDLGPFQLASDNTRDEILVTQIFLAVTAATTLGVAALAGERRRVEDDLRIKSNDLLDAQRLADIGSWRVIWAGGRELWTGSDQFNLMYGMPAGHVSSMPAWIGPLHPVDRDRVTAAWQAALTRGGPARWEHRIVVDGRTKWIDARANVRLDSHGRPVEATGTVQDITVRRAAEEQLNAFADHQRVLVREVNHRVKNNLAAIVEILDLEKDRALAAGRGEVVDVTSGIASRVRALASVHSLLSQSEWRPVRLLDLCDGILAGILNREGDGPARVAVGGDPVHVDSVQANNLALVLNELGVNSVKHARRPDGVIASLDIADLGDSVALTYSDDGAGFPEAVLDKEGDSAANGAGLDLVRGIVGQSLRGSVELRNGPGALVVIRFPKAKETGDGVR